MSQVFMTIVAWFACYRQPKNKKKISNNIKAQFRWTTNKFNLNLITLSDPLIITGIWLISFTDRFVAGAFDFRTRQIECETFCLSYEDCKAYADVLCMSTDWEMTHYKHRFGSCKAFWNIIILLGASTVGRIGFGLNLGANAFSALKKCRQIYCQN
jgi:hypothetical protein